MNTVKTCKHCGQPFTRRENERPTRYSARVFCGRVCSDPGRSPMTREEAIERFESYVVPEPMSGCWLWTASVARGGYGKFSLYGKEERASRAAFQLYKGDIPPGMVVRHKCDTPLCANPDHLELGTHKDNSRDASTRGRLRRGERSPAAKLTEAEVSSIHEDGRGYGAIAADYGISASAVCLIKKGRNWSHVQKGSQE